MDPNATLREIHNALMNRETGDEIDEWCEALGDWVDNGGFEPDWKAYPLGTSYYQVMRQQAGKHFLKV